MMQYNTPLGTKPFFIRRLLQETLSRFYHVERRQQLSELRHSLSFPFSRGICSLFLLSTLIFFKNYKSEPSRYSKHHRKGMNMIFQTSEWNVSWIVGDVYGGYLQSLIGRSHQCVVRKVRLELTTSSPNYQLPVNQCYEWKSLSLSTVESETWFLEEIDDILLVQQRVHSLTEV